MSVAVNQTLTNFARGLAQDLTGGSIAEFLAPSVLVSGAVGKYKKFDDAAAFEIEDTARALGSDPNIINLTAEDADYNCKPHALEARIDVAEREQYGEGDPLGIEQVKLRMLLSRAATAFEARVIAKARTLSAVSNVGQWSVADNDPVKEIDAQIASIATKTGQLPNALAMGIADWNTVRNHPKVIARFPGAAQVGVTTAQFASLLLNPGIEIKIGTLGRNTAKQGATKNVANIAGGDVFIFVRSGNPTQLDASFMKTFRTRTGGVDTVQKYTAPSGLYDGLITMWSEDIQVVGAACARRITLS